METNVLQPIPIDAVRSWHDANPYTDASPTAAANDVSNDDKANNSKYTPIFPIDSTLNRKIALWNGTIWRLQVDAITNSTNEQLKDTSGLCRKILDAAGKEIWVECEAADTCRTGEAVITRGCQLPARHIIHTVGPRYNLKYINAAESALHMCYRSVLSVAKEEQLRTLALGCIYTKRKGYPRNDAAHIAARTLRRFLEHYASDFDCVVLCVDALEDQVIYEAVLPLYFPRSRHDERQQHVQLADRHLGDAFGDPIIEERKIRIRPLGSSSDNQIATDNNDNADSDAGNSTDDEETAIQDFREMSIDPDTERLERLRQLQEARERCAASNAAQDAPLRSYRTALARARTEDFRDLRALQFLYNAGVDRSGAPVIVYEAAKLRVDAVDLDRVALFIIQTMDAIVEQRYSVLYIHAGATDEHQPAAAWLKRLCRIFSAKYELNLALFYVLEPTLWLKLLFFVARGFGSRAFGRKVVYLATPRELDNIADADALALPPHVQRRRSTLTPPTTTASAAIAASNEHEAVL